MMDFIVENKRYVITAGIGLVAAVLICLMRDVLSVESMTEALVILSDAFFIPGILFIGIGVLMAVANEGLFNGMIFGLKTLGRSFTARKGEKIREEDFYEYNARVNKKKSKVSHLFVIGAIFIAISIILVIGYLL